MKRFVGTKGGMSKKFNRTTALFTLFGIGQGSGSGPVVWLCHLLVLFMIFYQKGSIPTFGSPNKETTHSSGGTGYVDDCTLFI